MFFSQVPRTKVYIYIVWNLFWYSNKQTKTRGKYLYYRNMSPGKDFNNNLFFPVSPNYTTYCIISLNLLLHYYLYTHYFTKLEWCTKLMINLLKITADWPFNLLHLNISLYILNTVLHALPLVLTMRICLTITIYIYIYIHECGSRVYLGIKCLMLW